MSRNTAWVVAVLCVGCAAAHDGNPEPGSYGVPFACHPSQPNEVLAPWGRCVIEHYQPCGIESPLGRSFRFRYEDGHLVGEHESRLEAEASYEYDGDLLVRRTQSSSGVLNHMSTYDYDGGRLVHELRTPPGAEWVQRYEGDTVIREDVESGHMITWAFEDGLLKEIVRSGAYEDRTTLRYEGGLLVEAMTESTMTSTEFFYDERNRLARRVQTAPMYIETRYEYDEMDRVLRVIGASSGEGHTFLYSCD